MSGGNDDFQAVITRLWSRLGMQPPRFNETGRVQLRVESVSLDLFDNGRGSLIIEGVAGNLAADPVARSRQTRKILESNLGLLLDNDAGVYLRPLPNRDQAITVRASYPYAAAQLDRLVKKIEDTVQTMEYYLAELKSTVVSQARRGASVAASSEPVVIFRP